MGVRSNEDVAGGVFLEHALWRSILCDTILAAVIQRRGKVKSVRLDRELEELLERAARAEGVSESAFIRDALRRRCQEVLKRNLYEELSELGVIGVVSSGGGYAEDAGRRFAEMLAEREERKRRC